MIVETIVVVINVEYDFSTADVLYVIISFKI